MAIKNLATYIKQRGLVETADPAVNKPIHRKPGFNGIVSLSAMEENASRYLRQKRDAQKLNRKQVGMMVGIHAEIYARHERAGARLTVTRLLHLAELLDFSPVEALHAIAPQFFGKDPQEADMRLELIMRVLELPAKFAEPLYKLLEGLPSGQTANDVQVRAEGKPGR